jgi:hypothetical protein
MSLMSQVIRQRPPLWLLPVVLVPLLWFAMRWNEGLWLLCPLRRLVARQRHRHRGMTQEISYGVDRHAALHQA